MKVVIFCGGLGLRLREASPRIPKPMIPIGNRPILIHLMKYYATHGHTDFILCLGYKAEVFKEYFLNYNEALVNDFVLSDGGQTVEVLQHDIAKWRITFLDTGLRATVGQRLKAVEAHLGDDEAFLANYGDGLTDVPLPEMISQLAASGKTASFLCVRPTYSTHVVSLGQDDSVKRIDAMDQAGIWINGGFFVFRREIFNYLGEGEDLVEQPFQRLISKEQLLAHRYEGFWQPMDTLKDKQNLETLFESGNPPWAIWERGRKPNTQQSHLPGTGRVAEIAV